MTSQNYTTAQNGSPIASSQHSLTTGPDGVTALHDRFLVEKLASFNRERVPERNPHAKGGGAFGELVITEDVSRYTKAAAFQKGAASETLIRFSSVAGEQGSPDTWRDVRGFAVRFYTTEGNLDIVGNNTPVFFIRDAIKFPDFIHSQKRNGKGLRDADMQWDFWTRSPESAHQRTHTSPYKVKPRGFVLNLEDRVLYPVRRRSYIHWKTINANDERFALAA
jgi:catalase